MTPPNVTPLRNPERMVLERALVYGTLHDCDPGALNVTALFELRWVSTELATSLVERGLLAIKEGYTADDESRLYKLTAAGRAALLREGLTWEMPA